MTNEQILKKAIEKAVKNGFDFYGHASKMEEEPSLRGNLREDEFDFKITKRKPKFKWYVSDTMVIGNWVGDECRVIRRSCEKCGHKELGMPEKKTSGLENWGVEYVMFSHDFAKALWGEKDMWDKTKCTCGGKGIHPTDDMHDLRCAKVKCQRGYKFHLQQMVLEKEPLKYLEKFL